MKTNIHDFDLTHDAYIFLNLAELYHEEYEGTGSIKAYREFRYYQELAQKLSDLAWEYMNLLNEEVIEEAM